MNNWKKASFEGVRFFVQTAEYETGRKVAKHEFPGRDIPYSEDLGKKTDRIVVEAYFLGSGYQDRRDALLEKLSQGQGKLKHPYLDQLTVIAETIKVRESSSEQGISRLEIEFVEAGQPLYPEVSADQKVGIVEATAQVEQSLVDQLVEDWDELSQNLDGLKEDFLNTVDQIEQNLQRAFEAANQVSNLAFEIGRLRNRVDSVLTSPQSLANAMRGAFDLLDMVTSGEESEESIVRGYLDIAQSERNKFSKSLALTKTIAIATKSEGRRNNELSREILSEIEKKLQEVSSQSLYSKWRTLKAELQTLVLNTQEPSIHEDTVNFEAKPSLVLAYEKYGDWQREKDVRGNSPHPGFVCD